MGEGEGGRNEGGEEAGVIYLLLISVFQTLIVPSDDPDIVLLPHVVMTTAFTAALCPCITCMHSAVGTYQRLGWGGGGDRQYACM